MASNQISPEITGLPRTIKADLRSGETEILSELMRSNIFPFKSLSHGVYNGLICPHSGPLLPHSPYLIKWNMNTGRGQVIWILILPMAGECMSRVAHLNGNACKKPFHTKCHFKLLLGVTSASIFLLGRCDYVAFVIGPLPWNGGSARKKNSSDELFIEMEKRADNGFQ